MGIGELFEFEKTGRIDPEYNIGNRKMKFRKKPVIIEAEQWFPGSNIIGVVPDNKTKSFVIKTLEGDMIVSPGDWIITGVMGEKYPCKPDIFEKTYEKIGE